MKQVTLMMFGIMFAALCLTGCGKRTSTTKVSEHAGTYTLIAINGNKLPYTPPHEGGAPQVRSSTFTLNADGSFGNTMSYGTPSGQTMSRDFSGNYTRESERFTFYWKGAGMTTATLNGDTLTMNNEGILFAYRK